MHCFGFDVVGAMDQVQACFRHINPQFAVGERWVTGLTTATRCLRSARCTVEDLAQRAFPAGNSRKTLPLSGYPISCMIETKRTIKRRLIHTLHSVGGIIPRFGIAILAAAG